MPRILNVLFILDMCSDIKSSRMLNLPGGSCQYLVKTWNIVLHPGQPVQHFPTIRDIYVQHLLNKDPIERTGPCYPPVRSAYFSHTEHGCFLSMIMETRTPPRSPHKQSPEIVASCQLQQHMTRIGPLKRTCNCYILLYIVGLSPLEQQSWTCILYFGRP